MAFISLSNRRVLIALLLLLFAMNAVSLRALFIVCEGQRARFSSVELFSFKKRGVIILKGYLNEAMFYLGIRVDIFPSKPKICFLLAILISTRLLFRYARGLSVDFANVTTPPLEYYNRLSLESLGGNPATFQSNFLPGINTRLEKIPLDIRDGLSNHTCRSVCRRETNPRGAEIFRMEIDAKSLN